MTRTAHLGRDLSGFVSKVRTWVTHSFCINFAAAHHQFSFINVAGDIEQLAGIQRIKAK
jgi:hypothetical protein